MDRRFLTVLGVSLIFALVVSTVFYRMTAGGGKKAQGPTDTRDIVVAVKPIPVGLSLKPSDVKLSKVPLAQFPKGGFSKIEEVITFCLRSAARSDNAPYPRLRQTAQGASPLFQRSFR